MDVHPEMRFEIAQARHEEKLSRGPSRRRRFHAVAVLAVVIGVVSALAGTARAASSAPMQPSKVPGKNRPAPAPVSASVRYATLDQALAELRRLAGLAQQGQAVGGYGSFYAG
jgi:hypothetical protein